MITNITMKDCATYKDKAESLSNCKKINFIYGANGSGKSVICNFLMASDNSDYRNCSITDNDTSHAEICVYNKAFREQYFKENAIPGVFTLGKATIEEIELLNQSKEDRKSKQGVNNKLNECIDKQKEKISKHQEKYKQDLWTHILKKYEDDFYEAFLGLRGSKDKFAAEVKRRKSDVQSKVCSKEELLKRADTLFKSKLVHYQLIELDIEGSINKVNSICKNDIWGKVVVGSSDVEVGKLISELNNSDWVLEGRKYIANDSDICPFCQKHTIDKKFCIQLEGFFDKEYELKIAEIQKEYGSFKENTSLVLDAFKSIINILDNIIIGKAEQALYGTKIQILEQKFIKAENFMKEKYTEPGRKVIIPDYSEVVSDLMSLIYKANQNINNHNELIDNIDREKEKLIDDIWIYCIFEQKALIDNYEKENKELDKSIKGMTRKFKENEQIINKLEILIIEQGENITSVQPTVNEINRLLKSFGFTNFSIEPSREQENSYQIEREDETLATNTLSEGEETFITFLYFMQLTKGSTTVEKVSSKKIIILDDPISSLDSTVLYIVSTMVKKLSESVRKGKSDVEQLFIFTHNVFFHKEASFINGKTKELRDVNYWIIRKDNNVSRIQQYGMKNPISTSYELLWRELKENTTASLVSVQNNMRRIIENYFRLLGNKKDEHIINGFKKIEDQIICRSLISWINDGSHSIPDDLYIDSYTDAMPKYKEVFKQIFVNTGNEAHYNMMMGI